MIELGTAACQARGSASPMVTFCTSLMHLMMSGGRRDWWPRMEKASKSAWSPVRRGEWSWSWGLLCPFAGIAFFCTCYALSCLRAVDVLYHSFSVELVLKTQLWLREPKVAAETKHWQLVTRLLSDSKTGWKRKKELDWKPWSSMPGQGWLSRTG